MLAVEVPEIQALAAGTYWHEDGRADDYAEGAKNNAGKTLTISSAAEFGLFAYELDEDEDYSGWTVKLANNIDLSGHLWMPVDMYNVVFDGNNKTISNLTVNDCAYGSYASEYVAGMFGELDISTVRNLTLTSPVVDVQGGGISAGAIAGTTYGAQIRNVVINNPTVKNRANGAYIYILGGIVGSAWPSDELNSVGLYMTIINGAEVNGGEIRLNLSLLGDDPYYAHWHNSDKVYLGSVAGENYDSNIASANVSSTVITMGNNVGGAVNMETLCVGGIAGYTSATNEAYRACLLNNLSMANIQIPPSIDAGNKYIGGICGQVYNDSVVNNLYIGDTDD